jgi:hypothetical protein
VLPFDANHNCTNKVIKQANVDISSIPSIKFEEGQMGWHAYIRDGKEREYCVIGEIFFPLSSLMGLYALGG